MSFYSMPEYESWKESLGGNAIGWSIKYYKVLMKILRTLSQIMLIQLSLLGLKYHKNCFLFVVCRGWELAHLRKGRSTFKILGGTGKISCGLMNKMGKQLIWLLARRRSKQGKAGLDNSRFKF